VKFTPILVHFGVRHCATGNIDFVLWRCEKIDFRQEKQGEAKSAIFRLKRPLLYQLSYRLTERAHHATSRLDVSKVLPACTRKKREPTILI